MNNLNRKDLETGKAMIRKQLKEKGLEPQPPALTINIDEHYNPATDELYKTGNVGIDLDFIREGGLQQIKPTAFKTLLAIASHSDKDGFTFVSQQTIADMIGLKTRQQIAQIVNEELLNKTYAGRTLLVSQLMTNSDTGKNFCMYHVVNSTITQNNYNPDDVENIVFNDNYDIDVEDEDAFTVTKPEAVPVEESLFIMPKLVVNDTTDDTEDAVASTNTVADATEELTGIDKLRAFSKQSMPIYDAPATDVKEETQVNKDVDMSIFKEVHDATSTYEKPKFKRGSKTSVGSVKKTAEDIDAEYDKALKVFGL
ncbi:helix-turn-helix domain-containing protein [Priestia megaterium]|uniref:helix-turn-helix domain-containing protein n=1 Tax=Priestia megaterium TaxID=1404 RepID=UPI000BA6381F|nr:helix-turn-helix domain-containing protein [Priestia megaterium]PAK50094.1 hypothetical protein CHH47_11290 [Priestia megaterium]